MGTLIRTAAALGKKTVIVAEGTDPWNIKVVQASAGTIGLVNIHSLSWRELLKKKGGRPLAALVVKDGIHPKKIDLSHALLVIGNEAHGLPTAWLRDCEYKITLPMPGNIESLNAAVAGSIAMYLAWAT
jgi:TrmH family RNA methyltransferase